MPFLAVGEGPGRWRRKEAAPTAQSGGIEIGRPHVALPEWMILPISPYQQASSFISHVLFIFLPFRLQRAMKRRTKLRRFFAKGLLLLLTLVGVVEGDEHHQRGSCQAFWAAASAAKQHLRDSEALSAVDLWRQGQLHYQNKSYDLAQAYYTKVSMALPAIHALTTRLTPLTACGGFC